MSLLLIALFGLALARLHATSGAEAATDLPDDLWAAFEASLSRAERAALPRPVPVGLNTVGGMAVGDEGYVSARAASVDLEGRLWLDATAVVHPSPGPGRATVRRTAVGYHLQRDGGPVGLWDGNPDSAAARVLVEGRFD
jgi:hypothetical protein